MDHHDNHPGEALVNPLPLAVVLLALVMGAIELVFQAGESGLIAAGANAGWRNLAINEFGYNNAFVAQMLDRGLWQGDVLMRFVTYPLLHGSAMHAIIAIVFLLALGKVVGDLFGNVAVLVVFFGSSAFAAAAFYLLSSSTMWLIGGMPGAYGLIGAYSFLLWTGLGAMKQNQMRAFTLIGFLMAVQLLFGLIFGGSPDWIADLAGFVAGFLLSFVVSPGGWRRLVARLRRS